MTTYESNQKQIFKSQEETYTILTDLKQLEGMKDRIPDDDRIKNLEFSKESISFEAAPMGKVEFKIIEKEEFKTIKFGVENIPVEVNLWIQLAEVSENETRMKMTIKADIPMMLKPMIGNKLEDGIEKIADAIATALNK